MPKTIAEINERIKNGKVVVVTAEEIIDIVEKVGVEEAARQVDVVTTGTFGPMCSSSVYLNTGQAKPKIKFGGGKVTLNDVPAYTGFAAADILIGANALPESDPRNKVYPGAFNYGGGHVIEDLVAGRDLVLKAEAYGTDCYPRKELETYINIRDINEAVLFNPRNAYQNYNCAVNLSDKIIYTYMGALKPRLGNANYCSAGQLSPLLNDPFYKTIGIGTKIFLGGGAGRIVWHGTQHNPVVKRKYNGVPSVPAGSIAVMGDLKEMSPEWLMGTSMQGYGVMLSVGIGVPIPILDEEVCRYTAVKDEDIWTQVVDYNHSYPNGKPGSIAEVNYAQLRSGEIKIHGKNVLTGSLSSYSRARKVAGILKDWIEKGKFFLDSSIAGLPDADSGYSCMPLKERAVRKKK